jgi:hypothetical protein
MTPADRDAIQRLRELAERHRRLADILSALGKAQEASDYRALAVIHDERACRLERRVTAA